MEFLYPNVLLMMLLPIVLLIFLISTNKNNMQLVFNKEILDRLVSAKNGLDIKTRNSLIFISLIFMVLALARPVYLQKEKEIEQNLIPVIIALDVSKSMLSNDIYPNRLELSKKKIIEFLKISKNSSVGIILFAKSSFILSPITQDFATLKYMLENLGKSLNFDNGSNILGMLESANNLLKNHESKNIIIFSDGGNTQNFEKEIEFVKTNNIKVYSIGVATKNGAPIPTRNGYMTDNNGNIVTVKLNEKIKDLALYSSGGYINFSIDNGDIKAINNELVSRSKKEKVDSKKIKVYTELFYYPLILALVFLFISIFSFPKINKSNLAILFLVCFMDKGYSGLLDFHTLNEAKKAYEEKNYKYASNQYKKVAHNSEAYYNLGNSLYKEKKYEQALKAYEKVVTTDKIFEAKKLHNMGNAYVKLNNLQKAKEMYEKALKKHFDKETKENLDKINNQKNESKDKTSQDKKQNNSKQEDSKKDDQKQKDSKQKNDKPSQKEENKQNKEEEKQKNNKNFKNTNEKLTKKNQITELEEKKWMDKLKDQKTPILIHKMNTKSQGEESSTPW